MLILQGEFLELQENEYESQGQKKVEYRACLLDGAVVHEVTLEPSEVAHWREIGRMQRVECNVAVFSYATKQGTAFTKFRSRGLREVG
ncbi:hypothetical protein AAC03nite_38770 [Alicyclobacillus acidoterrestris]|nr:hypothetical protein AAC03nite_38770 [Alicyclobacillus acidoterrestris]